MECDVFVLPAHRRRGIASRLLAAICETAAIEQRSLLTWSTYDAVPAGEVFSERVGGRVARVNQTSELDLSIVDWSLIEQWEHAASARALGYRLDEIRGPFPEHLRADAVRFHHIMQTAPRDDLDTGDVYIDETFVAEHDESLLAAGREQWSLLVRDPVGVCVGGTQVTFEPWRPDTVFQQNTGIDPAHRRLGLAKWAKATMLRRIRHDLPTVTRVQSDNASSNAPMLAINDTLGFTPIRTRTEWQASVGSVRGAIASTAPAAVLDDGEVRSD